MTDLDDDCVSELAAYRSITEARDDLKNCNRCVQEPYNNGDMFVFECDS